jgi:hypothetical protein
MLSMDVFKQDAFSAISMTGVVDLVGYTPQFLGSMGIFETIPVATTSVFIETRSMGPALIQTDLRGAPPRQVGTDKRTVRAFGTTRLSQATRIMADWLQGVRAFGSETEMMTLQTEIARRQTKMRNNLELTAEHMRLGAIQGKVVDADGTTTLWDWGAELSQTPITMVHFDLENASPARGVLRRACNGLRRQMVRNLQGLGGPAVNIWALCGDNFWDDFITHTEVRETYLNTQAAAELRGAQFGAWEQFPFAGIMWSNYRGTNDNSTVAIPTDECRIFPTNAGIFQVAYAPAERFEFVNTMGRPLYSWTVADDDRDMWQDVEMYTYPLYVCTMPAALASGTKLA